MIVFERSLVLDLQFFAHFDRFSPSLVRESRSVSTVKRTTGSSYVAFVEQLNDVTVELLFQLIVRSDGGMQLNVLHVNVFQDFRGVPLRRTRAARAFANRILPPAVVRVASAYGLLRSDYANDGSFRTADRCT